VHHSSKIGIDTWFNLLCSSLTDHSITTPHGDLLPAFPSEDLQRNTTSLSGEAALRQACGFYSDISGVLDDSNSPIQPDWEILDFGSCWGRICRFFLRDVPLKNIRGIDVDQRFVGTCKELFNSENFAVCSALPPSECKNSSVNLITAYSVFSHLSEAAFRAWMVEFYRILKDDGVVAFTTRNPAFLDYCAYLRGRDDLSGYTKALSEMIPDIADAKDRYGSGEFIFVTEKGLGGGGAMDGSFYGEAFIPEAYVKRTLSDLFEILDFKTIGNGYDQALFVLKRMPH